MSTQTFSDFKKDFYSKSGDLSVFDCGDFNILKIAQTGAKLKFSFHTYIFYSAWLFRLFFLFKKTETLILNFFRRDTRWKQILEKLRQTGHRKYLLLDKSRYVYDHESKHLVSQDFHYILNQLGRQQSAFVLNTVWPSEIDHDFSLSDFDKYHFLIPLSKEDVEIIRQLKKTISTIKKETSFSADELRGIKCAAQLFWRQYRCYRFMLHYVQPELCLMICHYHNEGAIFALRQRGIPVIELQHGLIAPEDIFYIYPEAVQKVRERALFPDKILVFGQFWKERLLSGYEFRPDQIEIIGHYFFKNKTRSSELDALLKDIPPGYRILLVCTQTDMHDDFIKYVKWFAGDNVKKKHPAYILVKPHPKEKKGIYEALNKEENMRVVHFNINELLAVADGHLSIYSTTLYDACVYPVANFALNAKGHEDYVNTVVCSGVAEKIEMHENPFDKTWSTRSGKDPSYFYAHFAPEKLHAVINTSLR